MIQLYTIYTNIRTQITHILLSRCTVCKIRSADRETLTPGTRGSGKRRVRTSKRDECGQKFYFPTHGRRRRVGGDWLRSRRERSSEIRLGSNNPATGATTATITTTTKIYYTAIWEHGRIVIVVVVVVFVVRIVINIDGLCAAFETVRAERLGGGNSPPLGDVRAERISRLTAQTKGARV